MDLIRNLTNDKAASGETGSAKPWSDLAGHSPDALGIFEAGGSWRR